MRTLLVTAGIFALTTPAAVAQTDSCADFLKADAQMQAAMSPADKAALSSDPAAAALDRKLRDYCTKNPKAPLSEAMTKAIQ